MTPLREEDVDGDPLRQFAAWFAEAGRAGVSMPEAAALATAAADGAPSVRMVLVKSYDERGFAFYTHYASRKGLELAANPRAALLFHWGLLGRQVRIEGPVQRVSAQETEAYVRSRPRASQLSALASPQSAPIDSRQALEERVADLRRRYADSELPLPADWGGFSVAAESIEFWQQRDDRLHDRLRYRRGSSGGSGSGSGGGAGWLLERLAP